MTDTTQPALSQNDHQPKPLQNGFNPDFSYSQVDQSSSPSTEVSKEQLPASRTTRPKYEGDAAELVVASLLDRHFAGGKHLMLSTDGRFWHYDGRVWRPVQDQWISGKALETIRANPVRGQKTAPLLGQVLTLLKANLAAADHLLDFNVNSSSRHQLRQRRALAHRRWRR